MNKSLMISIRPEHLVNILNGYKTLELRKTVPKDFKGWVYIYCTKSKPYITETCNNYNNLCKFETFNIPHFGDYDLNGKVVARFWFDEYIAYKYHEDDNSYFAKRTQDFGYGAEEVLKRLCLSRDEFKAYGKGKDLYAWHIKKLEVFDEPKKLSDFYKRIDGLDEDGGFILSTLKDGEYVTIKELKEKYLLSKAPQRSVWVYTKEQL